MQSEDNVKQLEKRMADPYLCKEYWLQVVKPVERAGRLDHIKPRKAVTKKDKDIAQKQNAALAKNSYGMPEGDWYERIFGGNEE